MSQRLTGMSRGKSSCGKWPPVICSGSRGLVAASLILILVACTTTPESEENGSGGVSKASSSQTLFRMGMAHANGDGVGLNYSRAAQFYQRAADEGHAQAQYQLALLYSSGLGVRQDVGESVKWLQAAS